MSIGDKLVIRGTEYTVWLIEDGIYHISNDAGHGMCGDENWVLNIGDFQ